MFGITEPKGTLRQRSGAIYTSQGSPAMRVAWIPEIDGPLFILPFSSASTIRYASISMGTVE